MQIIIIETRGKCSNIDIYTIFDNRSKMKNENKEQTITNKRSFIRHFFNRDSGRTFKLILFLFFAIRVFHLFYICCICLSRCLSLLLSTSYNIAFHDSTLFSLCCLFGGIYSSRNLSPILTVFGFSSSFHDSRFIFCFPIILHSFIV